MIITNKRAYLGLATTPTYITDTSELSSNYLKLDAVPTELTAGKNIIKILGNTIFKTGTNILVEIIDSAGNPIYVDFPDYFDSLKRRIITIHVTDKTAPGPALITICSTLNDSLVPNEYKGKINFKWQRTVNIAPFKSNTTEIILNTPPTIELQTRIRPYITSSYRNGEEMITREYGDYEFVDYTFDEYSGPNDGASSIHQATKASQMLSAYTSASITAFERPNVYYLQSENYSADRVIKNFPVITPGTGFYCCFNHDILQDPDFNRNWVADSHLVKTTYTNRGYVYQKNASTLAETRIQTTLPIRIGEYYLISVDLLQVPAASTITYNAYLGASSASVAVTTGGSPLDTTVHYIFQADNDVFSFGAAGAGGWYVDNVRVMPYSAINAANFNMESDMVGGFIKIHNPNITPQISNNDNIIDDDTSYTSFIDSTLQLSHIAVDNKLKYKVIPAHQVTDRTSETISYHPVSKFSSTPSIKYSGLSNTITDVYASEYSLIDPYNLYQFLDITPGPGSIIYGVNYAGGINDGGGLFSYDVNTNTFSVLHYFNTTRGAGKYPIRKPIYVGGNSPVMYGATVLGGKYGYGTIYKFDVNTSYMTTIHEFGNTSGSMTGNEINGITPGDLIQASNGSLYGITLGPDNGGTYGTIFTFNTASNIHNIIHTSSSAGGNLLEVAGNLWYVKPYSGQGEICKMNLTTNVTSSIHTFSGTEGSRPSALTLGSDGLIYGATYTSSLGSGDAVIYSLNPSTNAFSVLFNLVESIEGTHIETPFFEDSGYFYGMTDTGGANGLGTVFRFETSSFSIEVLHDFSDTPDGKGTRGGFVRIGNSIYGTSNLGGSNGSGLLFRLDRVGITRPYVEKEAGLIYHHNAIIPRAIPATGSLLIDYPRWAGPIRAAESDLYSIVDLIISDLQPISGDISKIKVSAKPQGLKGEFTDLGIYPVAPANVLLDTNYVNHVQYADSEYRLTGYFKPVISNADTMYAESNSFRSTPFLSGWVSGSITNSYFADATFHNNITIKAGPESNISQGGVARFELTSDPVDNGLAYLIYTGSTIPPVLSNLDLWEQISYNLYSASPFPRLLDQTTSDWYSGSIGNNKLNLNNILVYCGIVNATSSLTSTNIVAITPQLTSIYDPSGISVSQSSGAHPYMFNNKLGWNTDTFFVSASLARSQSLYPAIFFEYNTANSQTFGSTISSTRPHLVEISNLSIREIGDRSYMINTYWDSYIKHSGTGTASIDNVVYDINKLMDSAKLDVYDSVTGVSSSRAMGYAYGDKLIFQTADKYKFYKNTPYIISFNAFSQIDSLSSTDINIVPFSDFNVLGMGWATTAGTWNEGSGWKSFTFNPTIAGGIFSNTASYAAGDYKLKVDLGKMEMSTVQNPVYLSIEWGSEKQTVLATPYTSYTFICNTPTLTTAGPIVAFSASYIDAAASAYITDIEIKKYNYDYISNSTLPAVLPQSSKLKVYGVNSSFGVPFADQLTTAAPGEFIGELEHVLQYNISGETKQFGRIEMEFAAETTGYGGIAFESDLGATWYISDVSITPKDRIGMTPATTRLFIKLPNELVNKPLTFKIEYLNDANEKASYITMMNDVVFTNVDESISKGKGSMIHTTVNPVIRDTSYLGPNSAGTDYLDPGTNITS